MLGAITYAAHPAARVGSTWGNMRKGKQVEWGNLSCDEFKRRVDKARRELVHARGDTFTFLLGFPTRR